MTPYPKCRWFSYGKPCGLLAKTNPNATTRSITWHAAAYGLAGLPLWYAMQRWKWEGAAPLWTIVPTCLFLAGIAAIIEWQIDDSDDGPGQSSEPPISK
jgi:hypothetical protein